MSSFMLKPTRRTVAATPTSLLLTGRRDNGAGGRPQVETAATVHEQEADAVAARIMGPSSLLTIRGETPVRGKVLRQLDSEGAAPLRSTGQPLPVEDRAFMERRFGYDFSKVRVHADSEAAVSAERLDASAYTTGSDIVFGRHQYKGTGSESERRLLAHELTHVIQQSFVPQVIQRQPKTPTKEDTVTVASVFDLIKAKNPDLAKLVTPLTLEGRGKPPDISGGPMQDKEEHHWVVDVLSAQGFAGSQISAGAIDKQNVKGGTRVTHHLNLTWALPLGPDKDFAKTASSPTEALRLTAAESLYHELLHAQIMMESNSHWTNPHTSIFQGYTDVMTIANSKALDQERNDVRSQIAGLAGSGGRLSTPDEISKAQDSNLEFLVHEKYDSDAEAKAFGKTYPNDFIAKQYTTVVAIRLGNDKKGPGFDSLTKPMKDAVKKLFDKIDAQAAQSNQSTTAPTNANPAPTKSDFAAGSVEESVLGKWIRVHLDTRW